MCKVQRLWKALQGPETDICLEELICWCFGGKISNPEVGGIKLLSAERRLNSRGAVGLCGVIKKGRDCV